eukprot:5111589-Prymnesium_polylepis.1
MARVCRVAGSLWARAGGGAVQRQSGEVSERDPPVSSVSSEDCAYVAAAPRHRHRITARAGATTPGRARHM